MTIVEFLLKGCCEQSMNFLAAFLLLHMEEEPAFWMLVSIVEKYLKGYFGENMKGAPSSG